MDEKRNTDQENAIQHFVDGLLCENDRLDMLDYMAAHPGEAERVDGYLHQNNLLRALRRGLDVGEPELFCPDLQAEIVEKLQRRRSVRPIGYAIAAGVGVAVCTSALWLALISFETGSYAERDGIARGEGAVGGSQPSAQSMPDGEREVEITGGPLFPFARQQLTDAVALRPSASGVADESTEHEERRAQAKGNRAPVEWFNAHMQGRALREPNLAGLGLILTSKEILAEDPAPAIRLVYADVAGKRVELFAGVLSPEARWAINLAQDGHLSMHWRMGNLMLAVIAPTDSPQITEIFSTVTSAVESLSEGTTATRLDPSQGADMAPGIGQSGEASVAIAGNEISIEAPDNRAAMRFVPQPRPELDSGIVVEPPQAVPDAVTDSEPEQL